MRNLKRNLRKEYKTYVEAFRRSITYEDFIYDKDSAKALAIVKEFHYFCMRDLEYSYDIIKKIYDIAYVNGFNTDFKNERTFYSFLLIKAREIEDYNLLDWGGIVLFLNAIIEKEEKKQNETFKEN